MKESEKALVGAESPRRRIRSTGPNSIEVETEGIEKALGSLNSATGTNREMVGIRLIQQIGATFGLSKPPSADDSVVQAINTLAELAPRNLPEAMLAAQMIATHEAAMKFMCNAVLSDQTSEGQQTNVVRATRLMRLHLEQVEAMQKLRGLASQQKVTVEHVHVYAGGQAVVGSIGVRGEGDGNGTDGKTL